MLSCNKWFFSSVQSLSRVQLFATPWTAAHQASLSITNSSSLRLTSIESVMPSSHLILCHPLLTFHLLHRLVQDALSIKCPPDPILVIIQPEEKMIWNIFSLKTTGHVLLLPFFLLPSPHSSSPFSLSPSHSSSLSPLPPPPFSPPPPPPLLLHPSSIYYCFIPFSFPSFFFPEI